MALGKGPKDFFQNGTWNIYCSVCGSKLKFNEARLHWQGMWRCRACWEPRHPQDFVMSVANQGEGVVPYPQHPVEQDILAPAFPKSGTAVTNTYSVSVTAYIFADGADFSDIKVNGVSIGRTATKATIPAGQQIVFTYTLPANATPPMWSWTD